MYFWTYSHWKTWLDKCLKSRVSEDSSTSNMVNGPKHCWNQNDSTFTIFIDPCQVWNPGWKGLSEWYAKCKDRLLTHFLLMTSIFYLRKAIYWNIMRCKYLRNEKKISEFFSAFSKFRFNFEHFQRKDDPHSWCIFELTYSEKLG